MADKDERHPGLLAQSLQEFDHGGTDNGIERRDDLVAATNLG